MLTNDFLVVFCLYYYDDIAHDLYGAARFCQAQANVDASVRLLEFNDPDEFDFLRQAMRRILREKRQNIEAETSGNTLLTATAMVGSEGLRIPGTGAT